MKGPEILTPPASDVRFKIGGVEYEFVGIQGITLQSRCWGVKRGDTRVIGGILFHASEIGRCHWVGGYPFVDKRAVCWNPVGSVDQEWIDEYKKALFLFA